MPQTTKEENTLVSGDLLFVQNFEFWGSKHRVPRTSGLRLSLFKNTHFTEGYGLCFHFMNAKCMDMYMNR